MGFIRRALYTVGCSLVAVIALAQSPDAAASGTTTDLFVMFGSDFDRPGLIPKANYNIGLGHTVGFLKKSPFGDELTIGYTYENSGTHGFLHTGFGEHTESLGIMKNFCAFQDETINRLHLDPNGTYELYRQSSRSKQT